MKSTFPSGPYTVKAVFYVPLLESTGTACERCGRLISNIVHMNTADGLRIIGQDCAKTLLTRRQNDDVAKGIKQFKENAEMIQRLEKAGLPYELNAKGQPCQWLEGMAGEMYLAPIRSTYQSPILQMIDSQKSNG